MNSSLLLCQPHVPLKHIVFWLQNMFQGEQFKNTQNVHHKKRKKKKFYKGVKLKTPSEIERQ